MADDNHPHLRHPHHSQQHPLNSPLSHSRPAPILQPAQSVSHKWRVTPAQKDRLLDAFSAEPYPSPDQKAALAAQLGVTGTQISKWFQHRRETLTKLGQFKAQYNRSRRTELELNVLQRAFDENSYPSAERLAQLEAQLENVTSKQIKLWFKHRRKQSRQRTAAANALSALSASPQQRVGAPASASGSGSASASPHGGRDAHRAAALLPLGPDARGACHDLLHTRPPPAAAAAAVYPPFSPLELMALRGALCMSRTPPPSHGLQALGAFLGRPVDQLRAFFDAELHSGYFWSYLSSIDPPQLTSAQSALPAGLFAAHPSMAPVSPAGQQAPLPSARAPSLPGLHDHSRAKNDPMTSSPSNAKQPMQLLSPFSNVPSANALKLAISDSTASPRQRQEAVNKTDSFAHAPQQATMVFHPETYSLQAHPALVGAQSMASPLIKFQEVQPIASAVATSFPQYQPVWYCPPPTAHTQAPFMPNRQQHGGAGAPSTSTSPDGRMDTIK